MFHYDVIIVTSSLVTMVTGYCVPWPHVKQTQHGIDKCGRIGVFPLLLHVVIQEIPIYIPENLYARMSGNVFESVSQNVIVINWLQYFKYLLGIPILQHPTLISGIRTRHAAPRDFHFTVDAALREFDGDNSRSPASIPNSLIITLNLVIFFWLILRGHFQILENFHPLYHFLMTQGHLSKGTFLITLILFFTLLFLICVKNKI